MNAKGMVLCPCHSGLPFTSCCGPFAETPMRSGEFSAQEARASLRRHLLEMVRVSAGMQELWFACLDNLSDELHLAVDALESQQCLLDHFLWDWFKKYSEARPIIRVARFFEPTDLRLANHLDGWSLAPWEPWIVQGHDRGMWHLMQISSHREVEIHKTFEHHQWEVGDAILSRVLHHAGHDFSGLHVSRFPGSAGVHELEVRWKSLAQKHGFPPQARLRPDIHNDIWLPLHEGLLAFILKVDQRPILTVSSSQQPPPAPAAAPFDESLLDKPLSELAGQTPKEASRNELGRHRLRKWLDGLTVQGMDTVRIRKKLGL